MAALAATYAERVVGEAVGEFRYGCGHEQKDADEIWRSPSSSFYPAILYEGRMTESKGNRETDVTARRMAHRRGIATLYKYRRCRTGESFGHLTDLLQGKLWFSPLCEFNDPFEGRPCYVPAYKDPDKQRDAIYRFAERCAVQFNAPPEFIRMMREQRLNVPHEFTEEHFAGLRELLTNDLHVFSMSASREHPLQWSHYADEHRGVCVHLDAGQMPISASLKVEYSEAYPTIAQPPEETETLDDTFTRCALTKATWWSYEDEYRLIFMKPRPGEEVERKPWHLYQRAVPCPPAVVNGITLGARMIPQLREQLIAWCRANRPDIQISDASLHPSEFKLEFKRATL